MTQLLPEPIQFGKYTLYERIGRGGMADVFKGRIQGPSGFERVFVIKRILPHLSDDPAFMKMFVEEAKMSARLNHPNIVQIFELGSVEDELFISMEHVPGHDLAQTMRALWKLSGPPRADLVAYVGREMCRALAYAHEVSDDEGRHLGMIHRDVSPSNVMLSYEGAVKLLDFGIAKALSDTTEVSKSGGGTLKGKYAYMAPEQTEGDDVDHRIDIFAAGIVLHEVLTGRRLFKGENDIQTIERVRSCEVRPPSQVNPTCPPALDAIVLRALARYPADRFQTAGEMADALDEIVHDARFTPQRLAAILRETFGIETGVGIDRRFPSGTNIASVSTSSVGRSHTVPPVALSGPRAANGTSTDSGDATDPAVLPGGLTSRPLWKKGASWAVALLCAGGVGLAIARGVGVAGKRQLSSRTQAAAAATTATANLAKHTPVLIQSEPEGADIYVTGKLESVGKTPRWVTLEGGNPARVMIRKAGFQDKAIAVEVERPPPVQLLPIDVPTTKTTTPAPTETAATERAAAPPAAKAGSIGSSGGSGGDRRKATIQKGARRRVAVRSPRARPQPQPAADPANQTWKLSTP